MSLELTYLKWLWQVCLCQAKIQAVAFRGEDAMGQNARFGKHEEILILASSMQIQRGCSYRISLGHALGRECVLDQDLTSS